MGVGETEIDGVIVTVCVKLGVLVIDGVEDGEAVGVILGVEETDGVQVGLFEGVWLHVGVELAVEVAV